jgi:hypothetical protein
MPDELTDKSSATTGTSQTNPTPIIAEKVIDALADIDVIMRGRDRRLHDAIARSAHDEAVRAAFLAEFTEICGREIRPAAQAVIEKLQQNGGGGEIDTGHGVSVPHPSDPRLTVWLSLAGEIVGHPRPDRHPYLQLDAESGGQTVLVSEGDMWQGHGGNRSGRIGQWQLLEITSELVTAHLLAIIRRAAT